MVLFDAFLGEMNLFRAHDLLEEVYTLNLYKTLYY